MSGATTGLGRLMRLVINNNTNEIKNRLMELCKLVSRLIQINMD